MIDDDPTMALAADIVEPTSDARLREMVEQRAHVDVVGAVHRVTGHRGYMATLCGLYVDRFNRLSESITCTACMEATVQEVHDE